MSVLDTGQWGMGIPSVGTCCSHGNRGRVRHKGSHEEGYGKVNDDCSPGGVLWGIQDEDFPNLHGEEMWSLRDDASRRGCRAGGLCEYVVGD